MSRPMHLFETWTEPEFARYMQGMAGMITETTPADTGFILLLAPMGPNNKVAQFVSNVDRSCAIEWMEETLARWKANDYVPREGD